MGVISWYRLFNETAFLAMNLPSFAFTVSLESIGDKEFLVTRGNYTGVLYDGIFLCVGMNDRSPMRIGDYAVYRDENADIWWGIYHAD